ncbi:MAG: 50S ribosomal protein L24 [Candidatus Aenigmatarchaeota archaeon]
MKTKFSSTWNSSIQPRKQRKFRRNAPLHLKNKLLSATLDKKLRKELGIRSLPIRKGDGVVVMRGSSRGKTGSVVKVDLGIGKVYVDSVKMKKASGQEMDAPIDPSNIKITKPVMIDGRRIKKKIQKKV